jgi:hypothetical protein
MFVFLNSFVIVLISGQMGEGGPFCSLCLLWDSWKEVSVFITLFW